MPNSLDKFPILGGDDEILQEEVLTSNFIKLNILKPVASRVHSDGRDCKATSDAEEEENNYTESASPEVSSTPHKEPQQSELLSAPSKSHQIIGNCFRESVASEPVCARTSVITSETQEMIFHRIETQDEDSCDDDPQDENFAEDEQELPSVLDIDFTTDELNSKCQAISLAQLLQQKEQGPSFAQDQTIGAEIRPTVSKSS